MGGNAQISFRLPADWIAALEGLALPDEDAQTIVKALLHPILSRIVTVERSATGQVVSFTGLDSDGKRVTLRCDGKPVVRGARPLSEAPRRGRPRKTPEADT